MQNQIEHNGLRHHLSPLNTWAFSLGTSIGWGSLVITSNNYLAAAGPLGSTLGLLLGGAVMLIIARSYFYMMNCYPEAGGAYTFAKEAFGHDHGFLAAWFLSLTYLAIFWANATSLPLFARYFLGQMFHKGYLYTLFGYDVYISEALLSIAAILLAAFFCIRFSRVSVRVMTGLVLFFSCGIAVCFAGAMLRRGGGGMSFEPVFLPDSGALSQAVRIACISPWAFIGFENISHLTEELSYERKRLHRILVAAVAATTVLYVFITLLSVTAYPPQYASWLEYIRDLKNLSGIEGLPAFYAANAYLGRFGVTTLILSLLALILTSLIGNLTALSRLFYALAKDNVLPARFAVLTRNNTPGVALALAAGLSVLMPFLGRTAIGWIVDVTTIGATITYGFVSASAWKTASGREDVSDKRFGLAGFILMTAFGAYTVVPNLFGSNSMERETFFLLTVWAILGFLFFRSLLKRDKSKRFGKSIIVWIGLLSLVLFTSLVWMSQSIVQSTQNAILNLQTFYDAAGAVEGEDAFVAQQLATLQRTTAVSMAVVIVLFLMSLATLMSIYSLMRRRAEESEAELGSVRRMANTDALTGVKSKHAYSEKEKEMDLSIASGEAGEFAVAMCDVNGLKYVNDTFGHKAGDAYIRAACKLICDTFEHSPVFRVGGDEFVAILTGRDFAVREELMKTLARRSEENIALQEVVVAGGCADFDPASDTTLRSVFERADSRMYEEKQRLKSLGARTRQEEKKR